MVQNGYSSKTSSAHIQDSVSTTPAKVLKGSPSATGARVSAEHLKEKEAANGEFLYQLHSTHVHWHAVTVSSQLWCKEWVRSAFKVTKEVIVGFC